MTNKIDNLEERIPNGKNRETENQTTDPMKKTEDPILSAQTNLFDAYIDQITQGYSKGTRAYRRRVINFLDEIVDLKDKQGTPDQVQHLYNKQSYNYNKQLAEIRRSKGLTQEEFAELLNREMDGEINIDGQYISKIETGRVNLPYSGGRRMQKNVISWLLRNGVEKPNLR